MDQPRNRQPRRFRFQAHRHALVTCPSARGWGKENPAGARSAALAGVRLDDPASGVREEQEGRHVLFADFVFVHDGRGAEAHVELQRSRVLARGRREALRARGRGASRRLGLNEARFVPTAVRLGQLVRV